MSLSKLKYSYKQKFYTLGNSSESAFQAQTVGATAQPTAVPEAGT